MTTKITDYPRVVVEFPKMKRTYYKVPDLAKGEGDHRDDHCRMCSFNVESNGVLDNACSTSPCGAVSGEDQKTGFIYIPASKWREYHIAQVTRRLEGV